MNPVILEQYDILVDEHYMTKPENLNDEAYLRHEQGKLRKLMTAFSDHTTHLVSAMLVKEERKEYSKDLRA